MTIDSLSLRRYASLRLRVCTGNETPSSAATPPLGRAPNNISPALQADASTGFGNYRRRLGQPAASPGQSGPGTGSWHRMVESGAMNCPTCGLTIETEGTIWRHVRAPIRGQSRRKRVEGTRDVLQSRLKSEKWRCRHGILRVYPLRPVRTFGVGLRGLSAFYRAARQTTASGR